MKGSAVKLTNYENKLIAKDANFESRLHALEREVEQLRNESMSTVEKVASLQLWQAEDDARAQEPGSGYGAAQSSVEKPQSKAHHVPTSFYAPEVHPRGPDLTGSAHGQSPLKKLISQRSRGQGSELMD